MIGVGHRFAGYELHEHVGHSGMGDVFKARDVRLGRTVALRLVPPEVTADPVSRARLNREATALAAIDHPNVPPIYAAGEEQGRIYIASRWVDGVSLDTLVREQGPLEPRRAVKIIDQVAFALSAVHSRGIMHRDVKPSSILVTDNDLAYLTDFALARGAADATGLTHQEKLVGKFDYVAPEYLTGADADERVDIYGLGCVLYEALIGEVPFAGPGTAAKMFAHASLDPPSAHSRRPEVPERLDEVIRRAMAKDPDERQPTVASFAFEAAGAVDLSVPLWASGGVTPAEASEGSARLDGVAGRLDGAGQDGAGEDHLARSAVAALAYDQQLEGFHEPVYFLNKRRRRGGRLRAGRLGAWALAVLLFIGMGLALLLALPGGSSTATAHGAHAVGAPSAAPARMASPASGSPPGPAAAP